MLYSWDWTNVKHKLGDSIQTINRRAVRTSRRIHLIVDIFKEV